MKLFRKNHLDKNAAFDGHMFETFGPEYKTVERIAKKDPKRIATLLDCDGAIWIARGRHWVNRLGYLIGKQKLPPFDDFKFG
ncbi:hypothetical protein OH491_24300 [Termitidicoccus mucosus]